MLEATEVLEHFQWKSPQEISDYTAKSKNQIAEELADTFYYLLMLSDDLGVDLVKALELKMVVNEKKYPLKKAKGNHQKYTEF